MRILPAQAMSSSAPSSPPATPSGEPSAVERRLADLGHRLPPVPPAAGSYEHAVRTGNLVYLSGGISIDGDRRIVGRVGESVSLEEAQEAARICLLGRLAVLKDMLGCLDRVRRVVALHGFVSCGPEFTDHPKVINGASDLVIALFGDRGRHSRTAVGCASLPLGVAVELAMIVEAGDER